MEDLQPLPLDELEELCDQDTIALFRSLYGDDPASYRAAIVEFLNRPRLPVPEILAAIRNHPRPEDAWLEILGACQRSAGRAPWGRLPAPEIERDINAAIGWLSDQLPRHRGATGVYLGLNLLEMRGGRGVNVEIAWSTACDPASDSLDWLAGPLARGGRHLIRGLFDLHAEYSGAAWRAGDERVAPGTYLELADYILPLGYSGIVLGHAFGRLPADRALLVVRGFHDGDVFLLGRMKAGKFHFL